MKIIKGPAIVHVCFTQHLMIFYLNTYPGLIIGIYIFQGSSGFIYLNNLNVFQSNSSLKLKRIPILNQIFKNLKL